MRDRTEKPYRRPLRDGLVLCTADDEADVDRVAAFNGAVHGPDAAALPLEGGLRLNLPAHGSLMQLARSLDAHDLGTYAWQIHVRDIDGLPRTGSRPGTSPGWLDIRRPDP